MNATITGTGSTTDSDADAAMSDPRLALHRLSMLGDRMATLRSHLAASLSTSAPTSSVPTMSDLHAISSEIASAAHQLILLGASLLTTPLIPPPPPTPPPPPPPPSNPITPRQPDPTTTTTNNSHESSDFDLVEIDAAELLAEHIHFCEICGKGFRRDANLRMHMRAHGDRFKTLESLSHPNNRNSNNSSDIKSISVRPVRFSCPFNGCNRNRHHRRFRPLKSAVCARNHFRRSHCPKLYACHRCGKKSFSVLADLRSHLKNCGSALWKCSCGTTFSRKDKLFGHLTLFQGHMPAIGEEEEKGKGKVEVLDEDEVMVGNGGANGGNGEEGFDEEFFDEWVMELGGGGAGGWSGSAPTGR